MDMLNQGSTGTADTAVRARARAREATHQGDEWRAHTSEHS